MGGIEDSERPKKLVFVTVGTTLFDALVKAVDTPETKKELFSRGYTHLLIQIGKGSYIPSKCAGDDGSLAVDYFTFSPTIADSLRSASLVISHAGSGSVFETLRHQKPLIVVVNEDLMDNHQAELAEELADRKHLLCASPKTLHETLAQMELDSLVPYPSGDAKPVAKLICRLCCTETARPPPVPVSKLLGHGNAMETARKRPETVLEAVNGTETAGNGLGNGRKRS